MNSADNSPSASPSKPLSLIATIYLIAVFYGSWVPLHFTPQPLTDALHVFLALPFSQQSIDSATDWATNFLLLIPLTFLWTQRYVHKQQGFSNLAIRLVIMGFGIATAFTLEFSQIFFATRTVSQKDIFALSLGALVGVTAQYRWGPAAEDWLGMLWQRESQRARLVRLLQVYLLVLFAFNVFPLDLTISPVELYHKWKEGKLLLVPFAGLKGGIFNSLYEISTDLLVWVPFGLFLTLDRKISLFGLTVIGWLVGGAIETAQLFVYSRVTDVTDILLAGIGTTIGGILTSYGSKKSGLLVDKRSDFWFSLWAAWVVTIICVFWFPFDFQVANVTSEMAWSALTRTPFLMLYQGSELNAANEILRKIGFFIVGGMFWYINIPSDKTKKNRSRAKLNGFFAFAAISMVIEGGQLFLPGKHADLTDILLNTGGAWLGMMLTQWVFSEIDTNNDQINPDSKAELTAVSGESSMYLQDKTLLNWNNHLKIFLGLTLLVSVVTRLPFLPYNIRELNEPGIAGFFSSIGLTLTIYWIANGHYLFLCWAKKERLLALPVWLVLHGIVAWLFIRLTVPMESIHDILGSPILDWPWELELISRYIALNAVIVMQAIGASLLLSLIYHSDRMASILIWLAYSLMLAWPLHWIVVEAAATNNLTELMLNGGSFLGSVVLALGVFSFFTSASAISAMIAISKHRGRIFTFSVITALFATTAFWLGSEQFILKYGKVFSTWQFLLSTNRENYVNGIQLIMVYAGTYILTASVIGVLQASHINKYHGENREARSQRKLKNIDTRIHEPSRVKPERAEENATFSRTEHLKGLDGLRAIAALSVFGVHFNQFAGLDASIGPFNIGRWFANGNSGVALFFVLSGFLLSLPFWRQAYASGTKIDIKSYFAHRLARILPAYYLCLFSLLAILHVTGGRLPSIDNTLTHLIFLYNINDNNILSLNAPFWTLAVEMQFYLLLPLLMMAFRELSRRIVLVLLTVLVLGTYFANYGLIAYLLEQNQWPIQTPLIWPLSLYIAGPDSAVLTYSLLAHLTYFLTGVTTALIFVPGKQQVPTALANQPAESLFPDLIFWSCATIIFFTLSTPLDEVLQTPHGHYNWPFVPILLGAIIFVSPRTKIAKTILESKPLRGLGVISYGLYIFHYPVQKLVARLMGYSDLSMANFWWLFAVLSLTTSTVIAISSYLLLERPVMCWLRKRTALKLPSPKLRFGNST